MCGILGVIKNKGTINIENFSMINNLQKHRGPDDAGIWQSATGHIALGHRRLSIIDLKTGKQPMADEKARLVITYNGEIYNYRELRTRLKKKGHSFRTDSDTEVILKAYQEWGEKCVGLFRGMFAFCIVDEKKRVLFLARDQFGIKPLVYFRNNELFIFASEIETLANVDNIDLKLDYNAIDAYLWLQYIPAPLTVYQEMKKLEPAHFMVVDFSGRIKKSERYWHPIFRPDGKKNFQEWLSGFNAVISDSVKCHTVADVSYGGYLSGGIDSTLIVKHLSGFAPAHTKTFSVGYKETDYNELPFSRVAAEKFGTDHHFELLRVDDFFSVFHNLAKHYGEPFGDSSAIPTYYVSKLASHHVKVVLSGDGGDELFGGYNSYTAWQQRLDRKYIRPWYFNALYFWLSILKPRRFMPERKSLDSWLRMVEYLGYYDRYGLWQDSFKNYINKDSFLFRTKRDSIEHNSLINLAQSFDLAYYLPYDILAKIDIANMMNGVESRVPFLDTKVADYALSVPETVNINENGNWEGKRILKKNLEDSFDQSFIYRPKQGFAIPLQRWWDEDGIFQTYVSQHLINSNSKIFRQIFRLDAVYDILNKGDFSKTYLLLFLEEWLFQYENRKLRVNI